MFKISDVTNWLLLTANPKTVEEIRKAPENVLSSMIAIDEVRVAWVAVERGGRTVRGADFTRKEPSGQLHPWRKRQQKPISHTYRTRSTHSGFT